MGILMEIGVPNDKNYEGLRPSDYTKLNEAKGLMSYDNKDRKLKQNGKNVPKLPSSQRAKAKVLGIYNSVDNNID